MGAIASLFFGLGALNKIGQQNPLDMATKKGKGFKAWLRSTLTKAEQLEAGGATVAEVMAAKAMHLLEQDFPMGPLMRADLPSLLKLMKMTHVVIGLNAAGEKVVMWPEEVIALQTAGTAVPLQTGWELVPLEESVAQSLWGGSGIKGVKGTRGALVEPTFNIQANEGPIGTILKKIDDKSFTRFPFPEGQNEASWKNSLSLGGSSTFTWRDTFSLVGVPDNDRKVADRAKYYQPFFPPAASIWPKFMLSTADSELVAPMVDILTLCDRKWAEWVMKGGVDAEWDGFLKTLNDMGLPKMLDVYYKAKVKTLGM